MELDELSAATTNECVLTKDEAYAVADYINSNLIDYIRSDEDIDNLTWLGNIITAYKKLCAYGEYK